MWVKWVTCATDTDSVLVHPCVRLCMLSALSTFSRSVEFVGNVCNRHPPCHFPTPIQLCTLSMKSTLDYESCNSHRPRNPPTNYDKILAIHYPACYNVFGKSGQRRFFTLFQHSGGSRRCPPDRKERGDEDGYILGFNPDMYTARHLGRPVLSGVS